MRPGGDAVSETGLGQDALPVPSGTTAPRSAGRLVLDADQIARACARMAHQILEANRGASGLVLLGIPTRGVALAHRLAAAMAKVEGTEIPVGALDVTMYRDEIGRASCRERV